MFLILLGIAIFLHTSRISCKMRKKFGGKKRHASLTAPDLRCWQDNAMTLKGVEGVLPYTKLLDM